MSKPIEPLTMIDEYLRHLFGKLLWSDLRIVVESATYGCHSSGNFGAIALQLPVKSPLFLRHLT